MLGDVAGVWVASGFSSEKGSELIRSAALNRHLVLHLFGFACSVFGTGLAAGFDGGELGQLRFDGGAHLLADFLVPADLALDHLAIRAKQHHLRYSMVMTVHV